MDQDTIIMGQIPKGFCLTSEILKEIQFKWVAEGRPLTEDEIIAIRDILKEKPKKQI